MCVHSLKPQPEGGVKNWIYNLLLTEFAIVVPFFLVTQLREICFPNFLLNFFKGHKTEDKKLQETHRRC